MIAPKRIVNLIQSNISIGLPINLYIGHIDFELESLAGDISFQYQKNIDIFYNEIKDVFAYISGNGEVTINISSKNLDILKMFSGGEDVISPFIIRSTNTSEFPIAVRIKGILPNTTGFLYYELEISGEKQSFTTQINVGPPRPREASFFDSTTIITIVLIICIIIVIIYMMYSQKKHRKK